MFNTIHYKQSEGIATITLNRPEVLNAFNEQMTTELHIALKQAEKDNDVKCIIITGAGRAFCGAGPRIV
jgi:2-(1,2-epoxy-1,2-dihydrophenyl)acetyl-CoA isomerase